MTTVEVSIPPEYAGLTPPLSSETAAATEAAAAAIVRLDELGRAPLGALGGFLLRSESVATSKIERISSDLTDFRERWPATAPVTRRGRPRQQSWRSGAWSSTQPIIR